MRSVRVFLLALVFAVPAAIFAGAEEVSTPGGLLFSSTRPAEPYLASCGPRYSVRETACVCGWFEDLSGAGVLIDGRPAGRPVTASRNALCFKPPPGRHRVSAELDRFAAAEEHEITVLRLLRPQPPQIIKRGMSIPLTFTVIGTEEPVWIELRNLTPRTGRLQGGDEQRVRTSGGRTNAVTRIWKARRHGELSVQARLTDEREQGGSLKDPVRQRLVDQMFRLGLSAAAARFEAAVRELPTSGGGQLYRREDVALLIEETRDDVLRSLPAPELAAFRDAAEEIFARELSALRALPVRSARSETPGIRLAAFQNEDPAHVEKSAVERIFAELRQLFVLGGNSPRRSLCVRTSPEDQATARLHPRSFPSDLTETATNAVLDLAVGRYRYSVSKPGFGPMEGSLDLVSQTRRVLDCTLVRARGKEEARVCKLVADAKGCPWP